MLDTSLLKKTAAAESSTAATEAATSGGGCVAAGDRYLDLARRCYIAALASERWADRRILEFLGYAPLDGGYYHAAVAVADHCALVDMPTRQILALLSRLAIEIPAWPDDPNDLASIVEQAVRGRQS